MREMHELEKTIGYEFKNEGYLRTALTHSSYANEMRSRCPYNERQEFLGDAVLSIIVSDYLFKSSHLAEGDLTKLRASIVCEKSLWGWAKEINLGDYILLGKGEENSGGRERPSIQADAFEALIAAVYLDSGMERTREFLMPFVLRSLETRKSPPSRTTRPCCRRSSRRIPRNSSAMSWWRSAAPTTTRPLWCR